MTEYREDCKNCERCRERVILEAFANIGNRTLGELNRCDDCNMFEPKKVSHE